MLVVGRTEELKVATNLEEANELLNEGWSMIDAKVINTNEFVILLAWYGRPRKEIFKYFNKYSESGKSF